MPSKIGYEKVTIHFKSGSRVVHTAINHRRAIKLEYEAAMVTITDSFGQQVSWPAADIQEVSAQPFPNS